jgi:uncharacterized protein
VIPRDPRWDALRGLAMLGVFVMNAPYFEHSPLAGLAGIHPAGPANVLPVALLLLGRGKFWAILALLFGAGIVGHAPDRHRRRMALLTALGVVHAVLVWPGDVLVAYALVGAAVGATRGLRPPVVLGLAALALAWGIVGAALSTGCGTHGTGVCAPFSAREAFAEGVRGGAWPSWPQRLHAVLAMWAYIPTDAAPMLAMALLGAWGMRARASVPSAAIALVPIGLALEAPQVLPLLGWGHPPPVIADGLAVLGVPLVALGAVAGLAAAWPALHAVSAPFVAVGRTSLSNYLLQSVVATAVVLAIPRLSLGTVTVLAVAGFAAQAAASMAWLRRFEHGPIEGAMRAP